MISHTFFSYIILEGTIDSKDVLNAPIHENSFTPLVSFGTAWIDIKNPGIRAGEMAQRLRALPALPKVLSSIPSNHMVAHNHLL